MTSDVFKFDVASPAGAAVQALIHAKFQTEEFLGTDFTDTSLATYLTTLISQGAPKTDVQASLHEFFDNEPLCSSFIRWLYAQLSPQEPLGAQVHAETERTAAADRRRPHDADADMDTDMDRGRRDDRDHSHGRSRSRGRPSRSRSRSRSRSPRAGRRSGHGRGDAAGSARIYGHALDTSVRKTLSKALKSADVVKERANANRMGGGMGGKPNIEDRLGPRIDRGRGGDLRDALGPQRPGAGLTSDRRGGGTYDRYDRHDRRDRSHYAEPRNVMIQPISVPAPAPPPPPPRGEGPRGGGAYPLHSHGRVPYTHQHQHQHRPAPPAPGPAPAIVSKEDLAARSVVVRQFNPALVQKHVLQRFFGAVGPVVRVTVREVLRPTHGQMEPMESHEDGAGTSGSGGVARETIGLVEYADPHTAQRALSLGGTVLADREVSVEMRDPEATWLSVAAPPLPVPTMVPMSALGGRGRGGRGGRGRGRGDGGYGSEYTSARKANVLTELAGGQVVASPEQSIGGGRDEVDVSVEDLVAAEGGGRVRMGRGGGRGAGRGGRGVPLTTNKWVRPGSGLPGDPTSTTTATH